MLTVTLLVYIFEIIPHIQEHYMSIHKTTSRFGFTKINLNIQRTKIKLRPIVFIDSHQFHPHRTDPYRTRSIQLFGALRPPTPIVDPLRIMACAHSPQPVDKY